MRDCAREHHRWAPIFRKHPGMCYSSMNTPQICYWTQHWSAAKTLFDMPQMHWFDTPNLRKTQVCLTSTMRCDFCPQKIRQHRYAYALMNCLIKFGQNQSKKNATTCSVNVKSSNFSKSKFTHSGIRLPSSPPSEFCSQFLQPLSYVPESRVIVSWV